MYRKGFLSIVILLGSYFLTQASCLFSMNIFHEFELSATPPPALRIHYVPVFTPTLDTISTASTGVVTINDPSLSQHITMSSHFIEDEPVNTPSIELSKTENAVLEITTTPTTPAATETSKMNTLTPTPYTITPTQTPLPFTGKLYISQVMYNPVGDEPENEWIGIYNPEDVTVELSFFKIGDEETIGQSEGMLIFPANSWIHPYEVIVIANEGASFFERYGTKPSFEIRESDALIPNMSKYISWAKGNVNLNNDTDEVLLLDGADQIIDMVAWSKEDSDSASLVVKEGKSIERMPADRDTNSPADWVEQSYSTPFRVELNPPTPSPIPVNVKKTATPSITPTPSVSPTVTDTPTPTSTSPPTPHPNGRLVISEVLFNPLPEAPGTLPSPFDVWIEIFNQETFPVDLYMYRIGDEEDPNSPYAEAMYIFPEGSVIQARSTVVIAYMADRFFNTYQKKPDFEVLDTYYDVPDMERDIYYFVSLINIVPLDITNDNDEILLLYQDHQAVDAVAWGNSTFFGTSPQAPFYNPAVDVPPQGYSIERRNYDFDANNCGDWQGQSNPSPGE